MKQNVKFLLMYFALMAGLVLLVNGANWVMDRL